MKIIKSLFTFLLSVMILSSTLVFNTSAAGTIIAFSKNSLTVGDSLSVTISIDAGAPMYGVMCTVNYNSAILEYKSGGGAGGAGSVRIVESPSGETKVSYTLTFNTLKSGTSAFSVGDVVASVQGANGSEEKSIAGSSANVTVNDVTLSANADLKALSLSAGTLSPAFNKNTTSYTISVKNSVTSCLVYATAAEQGAKVNVSGVPELKIGKNVRTVTVTAPSGAQKVYTITINRSEAEKPVSSVQSSSSEEEKKEDKLTTNIGGVEYTVATDISNQKLFKGFTASTAKFNDEDVAVAVDATNAYKIYFLKSVDSKELNPYTYDEINKNFIKLAFLTQGENTYIYSEAPVDFVAPKDFYPTTETIGENTVNCFANSNESIADFCYLYCYSNGQYGFYRYDKIENTLQRYPEMLALVNEENKEQENDKDEELKDSGFIERFNSLSSNAKIIVIAIPLLIILGITLLVLIFIKLFKNKNTDDYDEDEDLLDDEIFNTISFGDFADTQENIEDATEITDVESQDNEETEITKDSVSE